MEIKMIDYSGHVIMALEEPQGMHSLVVSGKDRETGSYAMLMVDSNGFVRLSPETIEAIAEAVARKMNPA